MSRYCVTVDGSLCSGFGACVDLSPDLFQLDGGGMASAVSTETDDPRALDAADACPMGAITVTEAAAA